MDLYLIYINGVGQDWKGNYIYEFLFSDTTEDIDGEEWDTYPASGNPDPPHARFVKKVGVMTSEMKFGLIQNSDTFAVWDAVDGMIAMGWEDINDYDEYPDTRIYFHFGDDIKSVEDKLFEKDIILDYKNRVKHEPKRQDTQDIE
jgi:hypothetical protein